MTSLLSMLLFYASVTGKPAYTLITDNWQVSNPVIARQNIRHPQTTETFRAKDPNELGDLNADGITNQADSDIYNSILPPFGWTVGGKVHWYRDCQYIRDRQAVPCLIIERQCLTCVARKVRGL